MAHVLLNGVRLYARERGIWRGSGEDNTTRVMIKRRIEVYFILDVTDSAQRYSRPILQHNSEKESQRYSTNNVNQQSTDINRDTLREWTRWDKLNTHTLSHKHKQIYHWVILSLSSIFFTSKMFTMYTFFFISNPNFDRLSLRFSKIRATLLATAEPQIGNS